MKTTGVLKILLPLFTAATVSSVATYTVTNQNSDTKNTAYDTWLSEGNGGSENEFLDWIKETSSQKAHEDVDANVKKDDDKSAYNLWLNEGNKGTEAKFLDWLKEASKQEKNGADTTANMSKAAPTTTKETKTEEPKYNVAYNFWLKRGNSGTEAEFLNWIVNVSDKPNSSNNNQNQADNSKSSDKNSDDTNRNNNSGNNGGSNNGGGNNGGSNNGGGTGGNVCTGDAWSAAYSNVKFNSLTVVYDGSLYEVLATGVPEGTQIEYANNTAKDVGLHRAFVRLYREDLGERLMTTTLTITKENITGITFEDATYTYNENVRNIQVTGEIPEGVEVAYTVNGEPFNGSSQAGVYEVVATLSGGNYEDLVLSATLTINKANISENSLMFFGKEVEYNGTKQKLEVANLSLPKGVVTTYTDDQGDVIDGYIVPGVYQITATTDGPNHNPLVMKAKLTIKTGTIKGITFADYSVIHDGEIYDMKINGVIPDGVSVKYTSGTENGPEWTGASELGVHTVVATLTGNYYYKLVLTAKLVISGQRLDPVTEITFSGKSVNKTVVVNWEPVPNAGSYDIYLLEKDGTLITTAHVSKGTSYEIQKELFDTVPREIYDLEIVAVPKGGDAAWGPSLPSEAVEYYHEAIFKPVENAKIENGYIKWDAAKFAESYLLKLGWYGADGKFIESIYGEIRDSKAGNESINDLKKDLKLKAGNYKVYVSASVLVPWVTGGSIYGDGFSSAPVLAGTFVVE